MRPIIEDTKSAAYHCFLIEEVREFWTVSEADSRSEIILVRVGERIYDLKLRVEQFTARSAEHQCRQSIVSFFYGAVILVSQAEIQCQIGPYFPVILNKQPVYIVTEITPGIGLSARSRIDIDLFVNSGIVREIE